MIDLMFVLSYRALNQYLSKDENGRQLNFMADMPEGQEVEILGYRMVSSGYITIECGTPDESYGSIVFNDPQFALHTILPTDIFDILLNSDLDTKTILLTFDFPEGTLAYRKQQKVWDTGQPRMVKAEMINITVKDIIKPEPARYQPPTFVSEPHVVKLLKTIWWTIATIGVLILGKLYLG